MLGRHVGPASSDLTAIHRAAMTDPSCPGTFRMIGGDDPTPAEPTELAPTLFLAVHLDRRIGEAWFDGRDEEDTLAMADDPVGFGVEAALRGPFQLWVASMRAARDHGFHPGDWSAAVLGRAREMARGLDDREAERLLVAVRRGFMEPPPDRQLEAWASWKGWDGSFLDRSYWPARRTP